MIIIYALINPINNYPFYVGATNGKMRDRLLAHIREYKRQYEFSGLQHLNNTKSDIIHEIITAGLTPDIILLKQVTKFEVDYYESFYYKHLTSQGYKLKQLPSRFIYQKTTNEEQYRQIRKCTAITAYGNDSKRLCSK